MKLFFIIAGKTVFGQMVTGQMSLTGMEQVNSHQNIRLKTRKPLIFLEIHFYLILDHTWRYFM